MNNEELNRKIRELYDKFTRQYQIDLRNPTIEEFLEWIETSLINKKNNNLKNKEIILGLKEGRLYCLFDNMQQAREDITGETDYILVLNNSDIKILKKWIKEKIEG